MTVDPTVFPGLLLLAAELVALAVVGYVVVRVALRQTDERMALAQGLVIGLALWGLITNFVLYAVPGLAGAAVGWVLTLILGTVLAWRAPHSIWPRPRVAAGFAVAFLVLFWLALASRQLLESPDPMLHLGLAAWIRAGGFPPELPWNPGMVVRYHHAADLLVGLLTPPVGPDLAFVQELLGAYAWTSLALVVVTALLRRGSWRVALVIAPLLLTAGAWTWTSLGGGILQGPVPAGLPAGGLGASLADIYWPSVGQSGALEPTALHDIWTPAFTLGYALAFVVLERAARSERLSWLGTLTLGVLVGFIGILATSLVAGGGGLVGRSGSGCMSCGLGVPGAAVRSGAGAGAGGAAAPGRRRRLHGYPRCCAAVRPGAGVGPQSEALGGPGHLRRAAGRCWPARTRPHSQSQASPCILARRDRLVVALAAGTGLLLLAWLVLSFPPAPWVLSRLAGHARNLALVALLLALAAHLSGLGPTRWRYVAGVLLAGLIVWPTVVRRPCAVSAKRWGAACSWPTPDGWSESRSIRKWRNPRSGFSCRPCRSAWRAISGTSPRWTLSGTTPLWTRACSRPSGPIGPHLWPPAVRTTRGSPALVT